MVPRSERLRLKTAARDDRIVKFYAEELTLPQVARLVRSSIDTVRMVLEERGIARRRRTDAWVGLQARNDMIVEAYKAGTPLAQIAENARLSVDGVIFMLKVRGIARNRSRQRQRTNRARDLKIAAAYRNGKTIKEAGVVVGLGFGGARDALLRLKVPIRTSGVGRKLPEQDRWKKLRRKIAAAKELYTVRGLSTKEIGQRLGIQPNTISKNFKRMGIKIRTGKSTITPEQVQRIRDQLVRRHETPQSLAREYRMSESAIRDIGTGESWPHIPWRTTRRYVPQNSGGAKPRRSR